MKRPVLTCLFTLCLVVALLIVPAPALAADRYELRLEGRTYVPAEVKLAREEDSHLVVQFYDIPTEAEREALAEAGITLLDYIPNYAWTAHVRGGAVQSLEPGLVRAVLELRAEDKILRSATGQDVVRAFVYDGVDGAEEVLTRYGSIIDQDRTGYTLALEGDVLELAGEDIVKCIMGPRPEMITNNDELRDNINADEVQTAPYNLSGNGLYAGIWDAGTAATNHDDYNSRLTLGDGSGTHYHATKCIGILGGDGTRSSSEGGSPYQWRGVATEVDLVSYDWPYDLADMDAETGAAISGYDIVVSSNSWSWGLCPDYCYYFGTYDDYSNNYDRIVRGGEGKKLSVVFSAGNDGNCSDCSGDLPYYPYGTIPGPGSSAKNTICVGSNNADNDALSYYSSRGPTLDGRLKPDIVAPGCKSYEGINTTYLYNDYDDGGCGTSYSCPAVAGCVVLTQEDYISKFGGEAWPSTVKALLIQGAEDQGNPGPDYQFGYGRVNIQNTIDIIRTDSGTSDLIKEDTLSPAETWEYDIEVTTGEDLKVTLVWDDYEGDYSGGPAIVNDLDLELEAPGGGIYEPWVLNPTSPGSNSTTGDDHLNNVEQVEVSAPATGTWTIRVTATVMPEPNQDFSVVTNFAGGTPDLPPDPPTGLGAVPGAGEGEIDVSWDANSEPDLDHYRLERADDPSFLSPVSFVTASVTYTDSGLTPGATYYYRVFAVDAGANESGPSATASADAQDLPPSAPTGLDATAGAGEGEIDIVWLPSPEPDVAQYRLERADNPGFASALSFFTPVPSYTDSGLTPGATYYYRAFAVDAGGNESGASNTDSSPAQDLPPAAPTGLVALTGSAEGEIEISWNPSPEPDFDRYRLERSTAPDFEPGSEPFEGAVASFTDTGLVPGQLYYYRVYAIDAGENVSGPSNVDSATAQDLPPAAPTGLSAVTGAGEGEIDVSWIPNGEPDLDQYRLERADNPSFTSSSSFFTASTAFTDPGLTPGATYWYRVYALDVGGNESAASVSESAVALDLPPSAPTGLVAVTGSAEGEIDISWSANPEPDIDRYRLERSLAPDFEPGSEPFEEPAVSYTDTGLIPGELYYYRVYAIDANENVSPPSNVDSAIALDLPPAVPTGLVAAPGPGEGEIDSSWDANMESDFHHYVLQWDSDGAFSSPEEDSVSVVVYSNSGLIPGELYWFRLRAVDDNSNWSDWSAPQSAVATDLAPATPLGLWALSGAGDGEIDVGWDPNSEPDFDHYRLERHTDPGFGPGSDPFDWTLTFFPDSGLVPGETYYYRVIAVDAGGNESTPSTPVSAVATDLPPSAPTGLVAVAGGAEGEIDISWNPSSEPDFDRYRLERSTAPDFEPGSEPFEGTVASFTDTGLIPGQLYYYRVYAIDVGENVSDPSNVDSAVALDLPPSVPTGLALAPGAGEGEIDADWDLNTEPDIDHYDLEWDTDAAFPAPTQVAVLSPPHTTDGLIPTETYWFRVRSVDAGGSWSGWSAPQSMSPTNTPPASPLGLWLASGPGEGEIDVGWDANPEPDMDHYRLERDESPSFASAVSFVVYGTTYGDSGLTPGGTYHYRVFAVDTGGNESAPSAPDSAVALNLPPSPPANLTAEEGASIGEVALNWDWGGEEDFYYFVVDRGATPLFDPPVTYHISVNSYVDTVDVPGTYYYRVFTVDDGGLVSASSDTVSITLEQTGISDEVLVAGVSFVRPNPFSAETAIHYTVPSQGAEVAIRLYDIRGRLVRTLVDRALGGGAHEAAWNGRDEAGRSVSSGVYFARVTIGEWGETRKIAYVR